jgi:hypothetical protein
VSSSTGDMNQISDNSISIRQEKTAYFSVYLLHVYCIAMFLIGTEQVQRINGTDVLLMLLRIAVSNCVLYKFLFYPISIGNQFLWAYLSY